MSRWVTPSWHADVLAFVSMAGRDGVTAVALRQWARRSGVTETSVVSLVESSVRRGRLTRTRIPRTLPTSGPAFTVVYRTAENTDPTS